MYKFIVSALIFISCWWPARAQEVHFGQYGNYTLTVDNPTSDLDFGQVISGSGQYSIDINNGIVIPITGVKYLDVIVDVVADPKLYLNGINSGDPQEAMNFTLQAAFANNKGTPNIGQAKFVTNIPVDNSFTIRFPILERQNLPPGPPPPPPTNAFDQSKVNETANLYLYGMIDVGDVNAGSYSSQIIVTISYD